jgi:hypothetical protein
MEFRFAVDADIPVADVSFGDRFRAKYSSGVEGGPLPLQVRRGSQSLTLNGALHFESRAESRMTIDTKASGKALRIRNGILHGMTDK